MMGVVSVSMGRILDNSDNKVVSFPVSSNVFKVAGGGQNYVHGGSSPQEMIVPVIDVKDGKRTYGNPSGADYAGQHGSKDHEPDFFL